MSFKFSPSSWGSYALCRHYEPSSFKTTASSKGTNLHSLLEDPEDVDLEDLSNFDSRIITDAISVVDEYRSKFNVVKEHKELELDLSYLKIPKLTKGYIDLVLECKATTAIIIDYKTGFVEVEEASNNWQMKGYVLGLAYKMPHLSKIIVCINQPTLGLKSEHVYWSHDIPSLLAEVKNLHKEVSEKEKHPFNLTEKGCKYCKLAGSCEGYARLGELFMQTRVTIDDQPLENLDVLAKPIFKMDAEERGLACAYFKLLEKWVSARENDLIMALKSGKDIAGYALEEKQGRRNLGSLEKIQKLFNFDLAQLLKSASISYKELSNLYAAQFKEPKQTKKSALELMEKELIKNELLERGQPSFQIKKIKE